MNTNVNRADRNQHTVMSLWLTVSDDSNSVGLGRPTSESLPLGCCDKSVTLEGIALATMFFNVIIEQIRPVQTHLFFHLMTIRTRCLTSMYARVLDVSEEYTQSLGTKMAHWCTVFLWQHCILLGSAALTA